MASHQRKYRVTKRFAIDYELFVWGSSEDEAVQAADSAEISSWNEFDSSWEFKDITQVSYLSLVEESNEPEIVRPVIKIWERTQAQGI